MITHTIRSNGEVVGTIDQRDGVFTPLPGKTRREGLDFSEYICFDVHKATENSPTFKTHELAKVFLEGAYWMRLFLESDHRKNCIREDKENGEK